MGTIAARQAVQIAENVEKITAIAIITGVLRHLHAPRTIRNHGNWKAAPTKPLPLPRLNFTTP